MTEIWKPIFGGRYLISSEGRVYSSFYKRLLSLVPIKKGYLVVGIPKRFGGTAAKVHRLVALAFFGPCPSGKEVNHKDTNKKNNRAINLEYITPVANKEHAFRMGVRSCGEKHWCAKLNRRKVYRIRELRKAGMPIKKIAIRFGVSWPLISQIALGNIWRTR